MTCSTELAHHIEHGEIFSHAIMFICAFTAWVRGPSILFTFILKMCHWFIINAIVVTRRSIIFIEHFLGYLITVNHSRTHFHLCPTGSQHVMSKWAHFHIWAMRLTRLSYWFITAYHGGREAGSNVFTCCDILGPFCGILDKSVWRWASLTLVSLLLYNKHVSCSNLQQPQPEPWSNSVALRCAKASRWSASLSWKAPPPPPPPPSPFWPRVII